jgi:hypothetical protein
MPTYPLWLRVRSRWGLATDPLTVLIGGFEDPDLRLKPVFISMYRLMRVLGRSIRFSG